MSPSLEIHQCLEKEKSTRVYLACCKLCEEKFSTIQNFCNRNYVIAFQSSQTFWIFASGWVSELNAKRVYTAPYKATKQPIRTLLIYFKCYKYQIGIVSRFYHARPNAFLVQKKYLSVFSAAGKASFLCNHRLQERDLQRSDVFRHDIASALTKK